MRLKLYRLFTYYRYVVPLWNYLDIWMLNRRMRITIKKEKKHTHLLVDSQENSALDQDNKLFNMLNISGS